jgi:MFS family permease
MGLLNIIRNIREDYVRDGMLSWIGCFSAFISSGIVSGIDNSFGESLESFMKDFNSTESNVACIGSVFTSTQFFSASFSSLLIKQYGFGPVIIAGILLSSTFFALSTKAYNVSQITTYYGIFGGVGLGMIFNSATIICSFHFVKRRTLATGIAVSCGGVGIALLSLGANNIDKLGGWQGYVLFCAYMCPFCGFQAFLAMLLPETYEGEVQPLNRNDLEVIEYKEGISR